MTDRCTCPWLCSQHPGHGVSGGPALSLTADHAGVQLTAAAAPVELDDRTVSGLVLPYGAEHVGHTSVGPVWTLPGRIAVPDDLSRVKLMDYHQTPAVAIGYCTALRETPEGLRASFHVAATPAGDAALTEIREHVRDGLSVELGAIDVQGTELVAGYLLGVALVPIPAWENARHDGLAAARAEGTQQEDGMTPEQRARLAELLAMNSRTAEEEGEYLDLVRLLATSQDPADATDTSAEQPALAAARLEAATARLEAMYAAQQPAQVPAGAPGGGRAPQQRDVRELYAAMARVLTGTSRPELEAALQDITSTANIWTTQTGYDGQLWDGLEYTRRYVDLVTTGEQLRSYKGTGWRWVTKPAVADYAGDKAAVPSNLPETEATEWNAARLAGAHDIDRKYFDFGDTEFIAAYYKAMTESYAMQSDDKVRAFVLAMAAANTAVAGATTIWGAAIRAANAVMDATGGVQPDYFLVSQADMISLADGTTADSAPVPELLDVFGVSSDKFRITPGVAAGTVVGGIKQAARFRELGSSPIRVETINIVNGGIDGGVFGYYALEAVADGGVQRATFA